MSSREDQKQTHEENLDDEERADTQFSFSAYFLLFGILGGLIAACEYFFEFIPAWEILVSVCSLYMSQVFREKVLEICLDLDFEVGTAVFLRRVAYLSLLALAAIPILSSCGVQTTSLTAVLTSVSFALGLASQKALSNMAAGIMIMIFQPFKIGDRVELENVSGFVYDIQLSETIINTYDNERVSLPNSEIYGKKTKNLSRNKMVRICEKVVVPIKADVAATKQALLAAVARFAQEHEMQEQEDLSEQSAQSAEKGGPGGSGPTLLERLDANHDGVIDAAEMMSGVERAWSQLMFWRKRKGGITKGLRDLFQSLDADGNGKLTLSELLSMTGQQVRRCTQALRLKDERRKFEMKGREPKPPQVVLQQILHDRIVWEVRVWVHSDRYDTVKGELMEEMLVGLKQAEA